MKAKPNTVMFIVYGCLVAFVSLQPGGGVSIGPYDKVAHFFTYGIFAWLAYRLQLSVQHFVYACFGIVIYSGLLEIAQSFVPGRDMSALDLLANALGVILGALLYDKVFAGEKRLKRD